MCDSSLRSVIVTSNSLRYRFVVMAESKLDLPEDLIGSKSSDQSWIPKGNPWVFYLVSIFACFDLLYLFGFVCATLDTALWFFDLFLQCSFQSVS